jgi:hypothetical protein
MILAPGVVILAGYYLDLKAWIICFAVIIICMIGGYNEIRKRAKRSHMEHNEENGL